MYSLYKQQLNTFIYIKNTRVHEESKLSRKKVPCGVARVFFLEIVFFYLHEMSNKYVYIALYS